MSDSPRSASLRGYMRANMPAVYLEPGADGTESFVERWLLGLEEVLDPVVALLDNLHYHLKPELVPDDLSPGLLSWLGLDAEAQALGPAARRRVLSRAVHVAAWRGTLRGLRLVLELAFAGTKLYVSETSTTTHGDDPDDWQPAREPLVVVRSAQPLSREDATALRAVVEAQLPLGVPLRLEVGGQEAR